MPYFTKDNREVEITETEFESGEGCYVVAAIYIDSGEAVEDAMLQYLEAAYQAELYQDAYEHLAASAYDDAKDAWKYGE
jgi:hypothetical protein